MLEEGLLSGDSGSFPGLKEGQRALAKVVHRHTSTGSRAWARQ